MQKMNKAYIILLLLLLPIAEGRAQEKPYYLEHRHSVTVSTGIPNLLVLLTPPISIFRQEYGDYEIGTHLFPVNLNIGYNFQFAKRWEVAAVATTSGYFFSRYLFTQEKDNGNVIRHEHYDESFDTSVHFLLRSIVPSVLVRFYWLTPNSAFQMYSAAGIGVECFFRPTSYSSSSRFPIFPVFPTITPVAVRFGARHWYGQIEYTIGATATFILFGMGYRF